MQQGEFIQGLVIAARVYKIDLDLTSPKVDQKQHSKIVCILPERKKAISLYRELQNIMKCN